ncbi:spore germination protein [Rossellomorea sp. H39__3]
MMIALLATGDGRYASISRPRLDPEYRRGNVQFGDTGIISPKNASKTYGGSGGFNTGPFQLTYNVFSATTTFDCNVVDQPIAGNN